MKRKFSLKSAGALLSGIALVFLLSATQSQAAVGDVFTDNHFKYTVLTEAGKIGTVSVEQRADVLLSGLLIIPGSISRNTVTYSVIYVAEGAFYSCTELGGVTLPQSVIALGDWAFSRCSGMSSITIPDNVTHFGKEVFSHCYNLQSITIPDTMTHLGEAAFYECRSLTEIVVGENNPIFSSLDGVLFNREKTILIKHPAGKGGDYAIPKGVIEIADHAFEGCGWLTKVVFSNSVTGIGEAAFHGCFMLTEFEVEINNPVFSSLDGVLFNDDQTILLLCPEGKSGDYTVPDCATAIADYAFIDCEFLTSVTIGDSVIHLGGYAFYYCSSLTDVVIGDGVTEIGKGAFSDCTSLMNLVIGSGVTHIGDDAFCLCYSLRSVTLPEGVIHIGDYAFSLCYDLERVRLPESLTRIGDGAFQDCSNLSDIAIPDELTSIGFGAFYRCNQLPPIFFSKGGKTLVRYFDTNTDTTYTIPASVSYIADTAFAYCESLKSVTIPENVTYVGRYAFSHCSGLTTIAIPDSLTRFGIDAFYESNRLPPILFSTGGKTLVRYFDTNTDTAYSVPASVNYIAGAAFAYCESLESVTVPESVTGIGDFAFWECSALTNISLPDTITDFGIDAFFGCNQLPPILFSTGGKILFCYSHLNTDTDYSLPEGVATIANGAFAYCESLTSVTFPESLARIGDFAFWECSGLETIYFKGDAPEIGEEVFSGDPLLYYLAGAFGWTTPTWNGYRTAIWGSEEPPALNFEAVGGKLVLTYSGGALESSSDLILWTPVEVTEAGKYEVDIPATGKMFFRIASK